MAVIKLVEDYAVASLRRDVRDSLTMTGEQSVLLQLFHPHDHDAVPCPQCGDDVYKSPEQNCTSCYGTRYDGGVRSALKVWALYTDHQITEQLAQRGVTQPDHRHVQFEAFPMVTEHDVLVRVPQWGADSTAEQTNGFFLLNKVDRRSLRTGSRFGQARWDVVGQKADLAELPSTLGGITRFPIIGESFMEGVELIPSSPDVPAHAVAQPDIKVIYFPFEAAPGGPIPESPIDRGAFTHRQQVPAGTWTIVHNLGFFPDVSIVIDGEEVETDTDYPNDDVVVLTFGTPQVGIARLT